MTHREKTLFCGNCLLGQQHWSVSFNHDDLTRAVFSTRGLRNWTRIRAARVASQSSNTELKAKKHIKQLVCHVLPFAQLRI